MSRDGLSTSIQQARRAGLGRPPARTTSRPRLGRRRPGRGIGLLVLAGAAVLVAASPAHAPPSVVLIMNVSSLVPDEEYRAGERGEQSWVMAQKFRTGPNAAGYTFNQVKFKVTEIMAPMDFMPGVSILTADSRNNPGATLYTLTGSITEVGDHTFHTSGDATLQPNTTYFVQWENTNPDVPGNFSVSAATDGDVDEGLPGWRFGSRYIRNKLARNPRWLNRPDQFIAVELNLTPPNSAPVFADATLSRSIAENTAPGAAVGDPVPAATDADAGDRLSYIMKGADAAAFAFDPATRQISTRAALDHEAKTSYALTIEVGDGTANDTIAVTVTVTDVNEPPQAPAAPRLSAASKTGLGAAWTAPDNAGRPDIESYDLRYRALGATAWQDGPQDVTGTGATIAGLAEETSYQVQLRAANDEGHGPWSASATGATSANSAPVFADATLSRSIAENTAPGAAVGDPVPAATDADAGDQLTYIMEGADAAAFDFDPATRQISTRAALDHEAKDSYALTIEVGDGTASDTIAVTITVTDGDELSYESSCARAPTRPPSTSYLRSQRPARSAPRRRSTTRPRTPTRSPSRSATEPPATPSPSPSPSPT